MGQTMTQDGSQSEEGVGCTLEVEPWKQPGRRYLPPSAKCQVVHSLSDTHTGILKCIMGCPWWHSSEWWQLWYPIYLSRDSIEYLRDDSPWARSNMSCIGEGQSLQDPELLDTAFLLSSQATPQGSKVCSLAVNA